MTKSTIEYDNLMSLIRRMTTRELPNDARKYQQLIVPRVDFIQTQAANIAETLDRKQLEKLATAMVDMLERITEHCERRAAKLKKDFIIALGFSAVGIAIVVCTVIFAV